MEKIRIFLTDDNDEIRAALHKYLEAQEDMIISGEAANGVEALQRLPECPSDVIILDLIMPQMDGFGVLEQVQRIPPEQRPRVIALTALGREDFIARALRLGVNYYMVKPVEMSQLMDRVRDSARQMEGVCEEPPELPPPPSPNVDDRMSNIFLSLGIPAHIKGYQFLREGVRLVIEQPDRINRITKELYPSIARRYATSPSKVERAIRHAIEVAWSRGRVESLNRAFGCRVAIPEDKPTNGEFIALIADKLGMEKQHSAYAGENGGTGGRYFLES